MDRDTFDLLLSREADDLLTPEDLQRLSDYTSAEPSAAAERQQRFEIQQALKSLAQDPPAPASDLASRIADRVLAAPAEPALSLVSDHNASPSTSRFSMGFGRIAAAALILVMAGVGGFWIGHSTDGAQVSAGSSVADHELAQDAAQWESFGCDEDLAQRIATLNLKHRKLGPGSQEAYDAWTGEVLSLLPAGLLEKYCQQRGLDRSTAERLIRLAAK